MKSLFVVSRVDATEPRPGRIAEPSSERRQHQRRMGIARRIVPERREDNGASEPAERRETSDRRGSGNRRRRPDRRIGLSPDLDLFLLGM